jgi:hypothetical protein
MRLSRPKLRDTLESINRSYKRFDECTKYKGYVVPAYNCHTCTLADSRMHVLFSEPNKKRGDSLLNNQSHATMIVNNEMTCKLQETKTEMHFTH